MKTRKLTLLFTTVALLLGGIVLFSCEDDKPRSKVAVKKDCNLSLKTNKVKSGEALSFELQLRNQERTIRSTKYYLNEAEIPSESLNTTAIPLGKHRLTGVFTFMDSTTCESYKTCTLFSDIVPDKMVAVKLRTLDHDPAAFTQGLEFHKGRLYEGTGQYGESYIHHYDPDKKDYQGRTELAPSYFGEGITILGDKLYQLTYKEQTGYEYDLNTMKVLREFQYPSEGWGLTNDGTHLIMTDGSNKMTYIDPKSLEVVKTIYGFSDISELNQINELEYVDGSIYANAYGTAVIVRIDAATGKALEYIDCSDLMAMSDETLKMDVMNGIAFNPDKGTFFLTGKYWPKMYEVRFVPKAD